MIFILFNLDAVIKSCVFFLVTNVRLLNALNVNLNENVTAINL